MRFALASLVAVGACSYEPQDVRPVDAPAADARPLGFIDGECSAGAGPRVLVYTYENMWRHASNLDARAAIAAMCTTRGFNVKITNDPKAINATRLAETDVVVFSLSSGSGLDALARADLEAWIRGGGGVVGLEAAAATEMGWPFFGDNLGAVFAGHPPGLQRATLRVEATAADHPIMDGLPTSFVLTDQWYIFDRRPEEVAGLEVLFTLDESTLPADFPDEFKVGFHAIGWAHTPFGGRVFYTGIGDNPETFDSPVVLGLLGNAIEWAAHRR
jgi:uncharacterized protein